MDLNIPFRSSLNSLSLCHSSSIPPSFIFCRGFPTPFQPDLFRLLLLLTYSSCSVDTNLLKHRFLLESTIMDRPSTMHRRACMEVTGCLVLSTLSLQFANECASMPDVGCLIWITDSHQSFRSPRQ